MMTSCYSDYIHLRYDLYYGARWNHKHSQIAFIAATEAYQNASGITAFPDGGTPKYLVNDVSLYTLDTLNLKLTKLVGFNDLTELMRNRWYAEIIPTDSVIYFRIKPTTKWHSYLSWAKNKQDSIKIEILKEKYSSAYSVDILTKNIVKIDSVYFSNLLLHNLKQNLIKLTQLNKILSEIPVSDWGLKIKEIAPGPDSKYVDDIIYVAKDGSPLTKRAIIEQIIATKSDTEIREILKSMEDYKNSLKGYEKSEYEMYSKKTYELIQKLL